MFRSTDQGITWEEVGYPAASFVNEIIGKNQYFLRPRTIISGFQVVQVKRGKMLIWAHPEDGFMI